MTRMLRTRICRVLDTQLRNMGFAQFMIWFLKFLYLNDAYYVYKKDIDGRESRAVCPETDIEVRKGVMSDLRCGTSSTKGLPWQFFCHEYDGVDDFFIAAKAGVIQHISWIYYREHTNRILLLDHGDAEIKHVLTVPDARGRGIWPRVLCAVFEHLGRNGVKRLFACVLQENGSSIRAMEKAGFRRVGRTRFVKLCGVRVSRRTHTTLIP
ncbi:N-acetyltransferase family protein [Desulfomicrobium salsuginis]